MVTRLICPNRGIGPNSITDYHKSVLPSDLMKRNILYTGVFKFSTAWEVRAETALRGSRSIAMW